MIKWILAPGAGSEGEHPSPEDLARLADGLVDGVERAGLIRHLNRCEDCYQVLSQSLTGLGEAAVRPARRPWWRTYALAASLAVAVIGYGLYSHGPFSGPGAPPAPETAPRPSLMASPPETGPRIDREQRQEQAPGPGEKPGRLVEPARPESGEPAPASPAPRIEGSSPRPRPAPQGLVTTRPAGDRSGTPAGGAGREGPGAARGRVFGPGQGAAGEGAAPGAGPELRAMAAPEAKEAATPKGEGKRSSTRVRLDPALADLLRALRAGGWQDRALVGRLEGLLRAMGVPVAGVERVILVGALEEESGREVEIRQEGPVLHLRIVPDND